MSNATATDTITQTSGGKMQDKQYVFFFGDGKADGQASMKSLLGGKGANLAEMTNLGVPVPPGFTISTEVCDYYNKNNNQYPQALQNQIDENLKKLEQAMDAGFGEKKNPLLVSVRSGAAVSMPGMMDTILNLGLNDETVAGMIAKTGNERFAWDAYRRFINMFGDVVMGIEHSEFEKELYAVKKKYKAAQDTDLSSEGLKEVVTKYKAVFKKNTKKDFPQSPREQLSRAINAVFGSWNCDRAIKYRKIENITGLLGTAVNVQAMVFGNMGDSSGTGVAFTRNPSTGEHKFYGEYLINAQGEDVVAGIRTPLPIFELEKGMPGVYQQLVEIYQKLESHYKDMQDIEFTIQEGTLFLLQTRTGKRTAHAAVRIAVEMQREGMIDKKTAVLRVKPSQLDQLLHPTIDPKFKYKVAAKGLPASPGAAMGEAVFTADVAEERGKKGHKVILVRAETSPEDIGGMNEAQGILTATGGMTSHAAVVARGMGKCCVAGCAAVIVDPKGKYCTIGGQKVKEGAIISLNGSTGEVIIGTVPLTQPTLSGDFGTLMSWADEFRTLKIRANADIPRDAKVAIQFGAEGIGLCRTEHMFFEGKRIDAVREMICAEDRAGREKALKQLLPMQRGDFIGIFREMGARPVTIRLLDPPLHEFVPHTDKDIRYLAKKMRMDFGRLKAKVNSLKEFNPMLGHRGCRLGITYPEIYDMQVRAIFEAACALAKKGQKVIPEIMIPLIGDVKELTILKTNLIRVGEEVMAKQKVKVEYLIGTMIEIPRAALTADAIAKEAEFFSFGTNDLTQMTFGFSRDDIGSFVGAYLEQGILEKDPFQTLDRTGVGQLIKLAVEKGRSVKPGLKVGICGEHGGDPSSIEFCHKVGLDYVSCSPYRVPIARLAAAHAAMK